MVNRRGFLTSLLGASGAALILPKLGIELPTPKSLALPEPNRTYWLPPEDGWPSTKSEGLFSGYETALSYIEKFEDSLIPFKGQLNGFYSPQYETRYELEGYLDPGENNFHPTPGDVITIEGINGVVSKAMVESLQMDYGFDQPMRIRIQLVGMGGPAAVPQKWSLVSNIIVDRSTITERSLFPRVYQDGTRSLYPSNRRFTVR